MNNNLKNISNIEDFLFETFYGKVSNNVYISNLPYNIKEDIEDMVLIEIVSSITDYGAMARGIVLVSLFAKPLNSNIKNAKLLNLLEEKLNKAIESSSDKHYQIAKYSTYQGYDKSLKWHNIKVELIIKIF